MRRLIGLGADSLATRPASAGGGWQPPGVEQLQRGLPQYEITSFLARGGMGAVYLGMHRALRRPVAVKVLPAGMTCDADMQFAERFQQEARAMAALSHPNIVAVHDAGETAEGLLYFVMDYIEGTDVSRLLAAQKRLPPAEAARIITAVCEALAFAHEEGIIHRDIKPSNVMIDKKGRVKVADFGLAKAVNVESTLATRSDVAMGTPDYIAPETFIPGMQVDGRADLYAVGVMLYQMLTGQVPRGRFDRPSTLVPLVDPRLDTIVDRALQTDRERRYTTATELKKDVERVFQLAPVLSVSAPAPLERRTSWKTRFTTATAALVIGAAAWMTWAGFEKTASPPPQHAVALRVIQKGGHVTIQTGTSAPRVISKVSEMPEGDFTLEALDTTTPEDSTWDDTDMSTLAGLPRLRSVKLVHTRVTRAGLAVLGRLPALRKVDMQWNTLLRDESDLVPLRDCTLLEELTFQHSSIKGVSITPVLKSLPQLLKLDLANISLRDDDVSPLLELRKLVQLNVSGTGLKAESLERLQALPVLEDLRLTAIAGDRPVNFAGFPQLKRLSIRNGLPPATVEGLTTAAHLEELVLHAPGSVEADAILRLSNTLKKLRSLTLTLDKPLPAGALLALAGLPGLESVVVGNYSGVNQLDDAALLSLERVASLREIRFETSTHRVTDQGVAEFQRRRTDVRVADVDGSLAR